MISSNCGSIDSLQLAFMNIDHIFVECFHKKREIRKPNFLSELAHYELTSFDCRIQYYAFLLHYLSKPLIFIYETMDIDKKTKFIYIQAKFIF